MFIESVRLYPLQQQVLKQDDAYTMACGAMPLLSLGYCCGADINFQKKTAYPYGCTFHLFTSEKNLNRGLKEIKKSEKRHQQVVPLETSEGPLFLLIQTQK